jgi:predicted unusual protein kinase regulating ubiquinone biosynthesis (AarF/ABC1/UbiB family)
MTDTPSHGRPIAVPSGRLSRLGRLGSLTAGVAGNMALNGMAQLGRGQRPNLRDLMLTPRNVTRIADELAKMRGAAMKVGQLMSMDTGEMLPPELAQIMARLRSDAHFMPPAQLKSVLNAEWPAGWLGRFEKFDVRPIAAASIGQVHRGRLRDGREMAIKVQYPGVARSIDSDVSNVGALIRMSGLVPSGFDIAPYLVAAREQLHDETDYLLEGRQLARFGALLAGDPDFVVPERYEDWTTPQILSMGYVEGRPIEEAADASQAERDRIAERLIDLMLREVFAFGLMQTDPNFANYRFDPATGRVILLDFGATREISPVIADQYRRLMTAGLAGDGEALAGVSEEIGFFAADTAEAHKASILGMIATVFEAVRVPLFDFAATDLSQRLQAQGMVLAESGFVPPPLPIDVLYLQRKFGGMFLLAARLGARVDVAGLLQRHL